MSESIQSHSIYLPAHIVPKVFKLTRVELAILLTIRLVEEGEGTPCLLTNKELAKLKHVRSHHNYISTVISRLVKKGLVEVRHDRYFGRMLSTSWEVK